MSQAVHANTAPHWLPVKTKINIALDAIGGVNISHAARKHGLCRNSVCAQQGKAKQAIHNALSVYSEPPIFSAQLPSSSGRKNTG